MTFSVIARAHVAAAVIFVAGHALSQDYPRKTIRIVTAGVGGGSDLVSRVVAQAVAPHLGQAVIVDNRSSGFIPGEVVSKAAPDGYTLLVSSNTLWLEPFFHEAPYDPVRDFTPITSIGRAPSFLVVHPSLPVKTVKQLIALAKSRPGELNYASGAVGSADHLAAELFKAMTGTKIVRVGYKNAATRTADLTGGHVQLCFCSGGTITPFIKSGRLRALAITSVERSAIFPDLPTIAATGVPGYEAVQTLAIFAPAKTPAAIINRLNQDIVRAIEEPPVKQKFLASGIETFGTPPERFASFIRTDMAKWRKLIQEAGIHAE